MKESDLPSRYEGTEGRIPESWEEFQGPATGILHLPRGRDLPGSPGYDVSDLRRRLTFYTELIDYGRREYTARLMNADLLRITWPLICRTTTHEITSRWEARLPGLRAEREAAVPSGDEKAGLRQRDIHEVAAMAERRYEEYLIARKNSEEAP